MTTRKQINLSPKGQQSGHDQNSCCGLIETTLQFETWRHSQGEETPQRQLIEKQYEARGVGIHVRMSIGSRLRSDVNADRAAEVWYGLHVVKPDITDL